MIFLPDVPSPKGFIQSRRLSSISLVHSTIRLGFVPAKTLEPTSNVSGLSVETDRRGASGIRLPQQLDPLPTGACDNRYASSLAPRDDRLRLRPAIRFSRCPGNAPMMIGSVGANEKLQRAGPIDHRHGLSGQQTFWHRDGTVVSVRF